MDNHRNSQRHLQEPLSADFGAQEDEDYYYLTVKGNDTEKLLSCDIINAY